VESPATSTLDTRARRIFSFGLLLNGRVDPGDPPRNIPRTSSSPRCLSTVWSFLLPSTFLPPPFFLLIIFGSLSALQLASPCSCRPSAHGLQLYHVPRSSPPARSSFPLAPRFLFFFIPRKTSHKGWDHDFFNHRDHFLQTFLFILLCTRIRLILVS